jgi:pyruvyl transferase EpsO
MTTMPERVADLRAKVLERVRAAIGNRPVTAMVDFPNYPNVGDTAIYLGQLACLRALGIAVPKFICDFRSYDRGALTEAAGDGLILLTGGGSFGDLWETGQSVREDIIAGCRNPIVQLSQTLHFENTGRADQMRALLAGHGEVTVLCRDDRSLEVARSLGAKCELCPDMAFALGSIERTVRPSARILWLARNDKESAHPPPGDAAAKVTDWDENATSRVARLNRQLTDAAIRKPRHLGRALLSRRAWREVLPRRMWRSLTIRTYEPLARQRLERGVRKLCEGEVVITDRLHGHILCMLLSIPHVVLDNSYGKLSSFHREWTAGVDGVRFAGSAVEAIEMAAAG